MRFYTKQHQYYCGIDLHARTMYVCILDQEGNVVIHQNMKTDPNRFLKSIAHYRSDVVIAVECIFAWYWLADLCAKEKIPFVLGHALYMKAIHGGKAKNDVGVPEHFDDPSVRKSIQVNMVLIDYYDRLLNDLELFITRTAKEHNVNAFYRMRSVPGIGKILALVILYEIHDINRFARVQDFASHCRLVKSAKESAGKRYGFSGNKIGNAYLKWAFSEAAVLFLRQNAEGKKYFEKLQRKHGKGNSLFP